MPFGMRFVCIIGTLETTTIANAQWHSNEFNDDDDDDDEWAFLFIHSYKWFWMMIVSVQETKEKTGESESERMKRAQQDLGVSHNYTRFPIDKTVHNIWSALYLSRALSLFLPPSSILHLSMHYIAFDTGWIGCVSVPVCMSSFYLLFI